MPTTIASDKIHYEIYKIEKVQYNGHADVLGVDLVNGGRLLIREGGHSDIHALPSGCDVLVRVKEEERGEFNEGLARIVQFSPEGRPIEFGHVLHKSDTRYWMPPTESDRIVDKR